MKSVISKFKIKHFSFLDDTLTLDRNHILSICNLIIKENLGITFEGSTRANLVDEELIGKMSEAGLIRLSYGLESVDANIRQIIKKNIPLDSYVKANKLTHKYNIETLNSVMIGLPKETIFSIKKTLSFLKTAKQVTQANVSIAVPYPGTELHHMAKHEKHGLRLMTKDFSKYKRYNTAVMQVGNLTPRQLTQFQNDAFVSIYFNFKRFIPMLKKFGAIGGLLMFIRLAKSLWWFLFGGKKMSLFRN